MEQKEKLTGQIHSLESFGTVDGPGIRLVVFFQGCPMRCQYCHNPDTWEIGSGMQMDVEEILEQYENNKVFYQNGGITATGGEPLLQLTFLTELFSEARKRKIHTCLDTSGIVYRKSRQAEFEKLFSSLNLVLLDFKHCDPQGHLNLTGQKQEPVLEFARALEKAGIPMIVRHVIVPGLTDGKEQLEKLGDLLASYRNLAGLEILPYHTMGVKKYETLGIPYPLRGVKAMNKDSVIKAREIVLQRLKKKK